MLRITVLSGENAHPRVMLAALTEKAVRHTLIRHDREIIATMRERGSEIVPEAEDARAALIASNRALEYTLEKAMRSPEQIAPEMELCIRSEDTYCGRLRFYCPPPETFLESPPETDAFLLIVSPGAPMLVYPYIFRQVEEDKTLPVCTALLCTAPPAENSEPGISLQNIAPDLTECVFGMNKSVRYYHPCGFAPDGKICSPENASPCGAGEIFWDLVRFTARNRRDALEKKIRTLRQTIMHRNSVYQSGSQRRRLELAQARAAYAEAVQQLYEAQMLLAAESGMNLRKE